MSMFNEAVSFVLCAIGKEGLKLKPEQLHAIRHVYDGKDFCGCLQGLASQCVTRHSPLCSTTSNEAVLAVVLLTVV